jgi:hypothetical protein
MPHEFLKVMFGCVVSSLRISRRHSDESCLLLLAPIRSFNRAINPVRRVLQRSSLNDGNAELRSRRSTSALGRSYPVKSLN